MALFKLKEVSIKVPFHRYRRVLEAGRNRTEGGLEPVRRAHHPDRGKDLARNEGLDREALKSLYSLFPSTRKVLREAGPGAGVRQDSVGGVAIAVLNRGLRPFLSKWHPLLTGWESQRKSGEEWPMRSEFRSELERVSRELSRYAETLAVIAGVGDQM